MSKIINQLKAEKRRLFRAKIQREQITVDAASQRLSNLLAQLDIWQKNLVVASYRALPGELSAEVFRYKYQNECLFVFPRIQDKSHKMKFVSVNPDKKEDWECSSWPGGWQPSRGKEIPTDKIDVFLVPALAFDRKGGRLGRGGGYYDRALSEGSGIKIGLAGSYQISDEDLPEEKHDIKMDAVVTDHFALIPLGKDTKFFVDGKDSSLERGGIAGDY